MRSFVALLLFLELSSRTAGAEELDLLLKNGRVLDGAGNPWFARDVGIRGDRLVFVGNAELKNVSARETLDLEGRLVAPASGMFTGTRTSTRRLH